MKLIKLNPVTNGTRHQINLQKNLLSKTNKLAKSSINGFKQAYGRSSSNGRITVWHKGGGCKRLFRNIESKNVKFYAIILTIMYDPVRNSFISLNFDFETKRFFRTLATSLVFPGSIIICDSQKLDLRLGYRTVLENIPTGSLVHSLSLSENESIKFVRAAGTSCQIIQKDLKTCTLRLPSGNLMKVPISSFGTLGAISNAQDKLVYLGKAGRNRHKGIRPTVRGIAMNPVDHPHGGRTNGGRPSVTPWGIPTKGKPTVLKKKRYE